MDISALKVILDTLNSVGITQVIIEPLDEGGTMVRGSNKDRTILVFDKLEDRLVDMPMGIQSVPGLLSRIQLFDEEKASIKLEDNGSIILSATVKQGKKKASFRFVDPTKRDTLPVPARIPGVLKIQENCITLSDDYVKYISAAIMAMSYTGNKADRTLSLSKGSDGVTINVSDGEDDDFTDTLENTIDFELDSTVNYEISSFERLIKVSRDFNVKKESRFTINEHQVAIFDLGVLNVLAAPSH